MRPYLVALVCVCAFVGQLAAASPTGSNSLAWRRYKLQHGKIYAAEEEATRFANFLANKQLVDAHNANPNESYKMQLNHLADLSQEEFQQMNGFKLSEMEAFAKSAAGRVELPEKLSGLLEGPVPKELDWREVPNRVSAVKNQGRCSSCWAFSTTGLLEGQQAKHNFSKIVPLSEQELIDCSRNNLGCSGGFMQYALQDIAEELGGIDSEEDYAYDGLNHECRLDKSKFVMTTKGAHLLRQGDEQALLKAVANYGPVSVAVDATTKLMHYKSGILNDRTCSPKALNHAVLVVGYGHDAKDGDFWIVKNSWGSEWGEDGYFRMKRGVNLCGIAEYPTLADF